MTEKSTPLDYARKGYRGPTAPIPPKATVQSQPQAPAPLPPSAGEKK